MILIFCFCNWLIWPLALAVADNPHDGLRGSFSLLALGVFGRTKLFPYLHVILTWTRPLPPALVPSNNKKISFQPDVALSPSYSFFPFYLSFFFLFNSHWGSNFYFLIICVCITFNIRFLNLIKCGEIHNL